MELDRFFLKGRLIPAVIQEAATGEVLMLAYMDKEALRRTLQTLSLIHIFCRWICTNPIRINSSWRMVKSGCHSARSRGWAAPPLRV